MSRKLGRSAVVVTCLLLQAVGAHAQQVAAPGSAELIVTAPRGGTSGGIAPLVTLSPEEIDSYGADTLSDLVESLRPLTRSSRSDQLPVVLLNGRLAGQVEFDNLPREAIERVEVLPESVALQYGFSENQRVLNFILKPHYRAMPLRASDSGATEGGDQLVYSEGSYVRLEDEARVTVLGSYKDNAWLRESDRGIDLPDSDARTLQPAKTDAKLAATVSRSILGVSSSWEAAVGLTTTRSLQGLATGGSDIDSVHTLEQSTHESTGRLAGQLTGQWDRFIWGATVSYVHIRTRSSSDTAVDPDGTLLMDETNAGFNGGNLQLSLSGRAFTAPAGPVIANVKFGLQYQGFDTEDAMPMSSLAVTHLVRTVRTGNFNARVPLASRDRDVLPALGTLAGTVNVTLDHVSDFGTLWSSSWGLDWLPFSKIHLDAIVTDHQTAPTVQQLRAPAIYTPNLEMFDFVNGSTAYVTSISGGNPTLNASDARTASVGVSLGPFLGKTTFVAHYEESRTRDAVGVLPPVTANVEAAFPDRFTRDADGTLVEVDDRWLNLARERTADLKWGLNLWVPLGAGDGSQGMPERVEVSLFDTWYLHDTILARGAVPTLDLLNGAPSDVTGGQPRHKIEFHTLVYHDGLGALLAAAWHPATFVGDGNAADTIRFSALGTADLRLFADLQRMPLTRNLSWVEGARMSLAITNLFDRRQSVDDSRGQTPGAFLPGYLDPPGRMIAVGVRKVF